MYLPAEFFLVACVFISLFLINKVYRNKCMRCKKRGLFGYRNAFRDGRNEGKIMHQGRICRGCRVDLESEGGAQSWKVK
jgi:hypothetical protein